MELEKNENKQKEAGIGPYFKKHQLVVTIIFQYQSDGQEKIYGAYCSISDNEKEKICWLKEDFIWGFAGPVVGVLIFNLYILFTGLRVAYTVFKFHKFEVFHSGKVQIVFQTNIGNLGVILLTVHGFK